MAVRDVSPEPGVGRGPGSVVIGRFPLYLNFVRIHEALFALPFAYIGMILTGSFFIAMGLFCSAITGSQILAALLCWVMIILFIISKGLAEMLSLTGTWLGDMLEYIEPNSQHLEPFFTGVIDPKNVLFFLSFIAFFLFLSVRSIETRKWR